MKDYPVLWVRVALHIPCAASLKDKRMIRQRIVDRLRNRFHISVAEIASQEAHQLLTLGMAGIVANRALGDALLARITQQIVTLADCEIIEMEHAYL